MNDDIVLVLKDDSGELYTLTKEALELFKVAPGAAVDRIRNAISGKSVHPTSLGPGIEVVGSFQRSEDPAIKREFVEPLLQILGPDHPTGNP